MQQVWSLRGVATFRLRIEVPRHIAQVQRHLLAQRNRKVQLAPILVGRIFQLGVPTFQRLLGDTRLNALQHLIPLTVTTFPLHIVQPPLNVRELVTVPRHGATTFQRKVGQLPQSVLRLTVPCQLGVIRSLWIAANILQNALTRVRALLSGAIVFQLLTVVPTLIVQGRDQNVFHQKLYRLLVMLCPPSFVHLWRDFLDVNEARHVLYFTRS